MSPDLNYPQLYQDTDTQYNADIQAQQDALRAKIEAQDRLKEAAYANPQRSLAQALTQAFAGAIPSLTGALVGGQRGAGYGMQAGGEGAEKLGLYYDAQGKENKQLAENEFANAIRDRQTQENQIELLKQRRNEALLGLSGKQIEEEGQEKRSIRSDEENRRYHNAILQERKDIQTEADARRAEKENQLGAFSVENIRKGAQNLESLPSNIGIKPGATVKDKDIEAVRGAVDTLDKQSEYFKKADELIDKYGGMSVESLPQNPYFLADLNRLRGLYMQLDPTNPLYKQGLTETERKQVYSQLGPVAVDLDFKNLGSIFATAKGTKHSVEEDVTSRRNILSKFVENRNMFLYPPSTDAKEVARRTNERAKAKQAYIDQQRKDYLAIQRGGGTIDELDEADRPLTAIEKMQALQEALGVK